MEEVIEHDNATMKTTTGPFTGSCRDNTVNVAGHKREDLVDARFLPAGTRTVTTELLRLCSPGIRNEERPVVRNELLLELHRAECVDVLGIVGDDGLGDRLADGVHLRGVTSTLDTDADVDALERLLAGDKDTLVNLEAELLGLEEVDGRAVDADDALALTSVRDRRSSLWNRELVLFQ